MKLMAAFAILCWSTHSADACSLSPCGITYAAPTGAVPLNTPGFVIGAAHSAFNAAGSVTLKDGAGSSIATTMTALLGGAYLVTPTTTLGAGKYTLAFGSTGAFACTGDTSFELTPSADIPTAFGTAAFEGSRVVDAVTVSNGGSCYARVRASVATFALSASDAMKPFLPTTRFTLNVDGQLWVSSNYGSRSADVPGAVARSVESVFTRCSNESGSDAGVPAGVHNAELIVEIAGQPAMAPLAFTFSTDCASETVPTETVPTETAEGEGEGPNLGDDVRPKRGCDAVQPGLGFVFAALALMRKRRVASWSKRRG